MSEHLQSPFQARPRENNASLTRGGKHEKIGGVLPDVIIANIDAEVATKLMNGSSEH